MLQIKDIKKQYKTGGLVQKALDGVSLNLRDNEFVAILGPSGSGKTTLLNIIGGLDRYDSGDLIINGISTKKYKDKDWDSYRNHTIGFIFQSYNLIPHQSVLANVELALTISGISKSERKKRAQEALDKVGLGDQGHKKPNQLSGGQMQRVAIARALVNNPDILLADEPTGALDSETSVQVMDLLKEVATDKLVVMVTHNPDLADQYATRIVKLKDGKITDDSDPYEVNEIMPPTHKNMGKASMSFMTALSLSLNNLMTKKARTILTSFAGSIGIIGIALILALSTGVNEYISSIEEETLSEYPLEINSSGIDMTSMMEMSLDNGSGGSGESDSESSEESEEEIQVMQIISSMLSKIGSNDLEAFKEYLESGESDIEDYVKAIEYEYDISPQLYLSDGDDYVQVNPDSSMSSLGITTSSSSIVSSYVTTDVFFQLPESESLYEDQYELLAGEWPDEYNEVILVTSSNGLISDYMLYSLGLRDHDELEDMLSTFASGEEVEEISIQDSYSYDEIIGTTYKLVNASDYYEYNSEYNTYVDKTDNESYMKKLVENGEDVTIVGIVQPAEDASITMLDVGIGYLSSLTDYVIEQAEASEIVQAQLADPNINVFTGEAFDDESESDFDLEDLVTIDEDALSNAITFDTSALNVDVDTSSLDLSNLSIDTSSMSNMDFDIDMDSIMAGLTLDLTEDQVNTISTSLMTGYYAYLTENPTATIQEYLVTDEAESLLMAGVVQVLNESGVMNQFQEALTAEIQTAMASYIATYTETLTSAIETQVSAAITEMMGEYSESLASSLENAISIDTDAFAEAFQINMDTEELSELMISMLSGDEDSYDNNLSELGYVDKDAPYSINIYPIDFESKEEVVNILDAYNDRMEEEDPDKVISYTDYVGVLMSSVTTIIDTVSYVLIAFVSISLVVSSIMIGVITYISVLERKKEIGILRSIGASKGNVSAVFNAETILIGLLAGLIGIGLSELSLFPINYIIHVVSGNYDVNAILPIASALALIALSVLLTLIGGIIPSRKAANSDPVEALRTE